MGMWLRCTNQTVQTDVFFILLHKKFIHVPQKLRSAAGPTSQPLHTWCVCVCVCHLWPHIMYTRNLQPLCCSSVSAGDLLSSCSYHAPRHGWHHGSCWCFIIQYGLRSPDCAGAQEEHRRCTRSCYLSTDSEVIFKCHKSKQDWKGVIRTGIHTCVPWKF
jgi:hypothetical protein